MASLLLAMKQWNNETMIRLTDLSINPQQETDKIVHFIQKTLDNAGFTRLVIGLSGGIDSSVSCALATHAIGRENVYLGIFPYGDLNKEGENDAKLLANSLKIPTKNIRLVNIKRLVDPIIALDPEMNDLRRGNLMVRMRMMLLYDLSKKHQALVLGTENRTEHLLGYFTRFGDEASDIEPIIHLYKTQVRQLAKHLNIPEKIIQTTPTAGMWHGQTDEGELGFTYREADEILHLYFEKEYNFEKLVKSGLNRNVVVKVLERVEKNKFKHELPKHN